MAISNTATICSIKRRPSSLNLKSMEDSLAKHGHDRFPETIVYKGPYRESSGRYRTGLDENAEYIKNLPLEEQEFERRKVREWRLELQEKMGFPDPTNLSETHGLGPFAPFYRDMIDPTKYGSDNVCEMARLTGNVTVFSLARPKDLIQYAFLRVHPHVAPSWTHYDKGLAKNKTEIQFYVNDPQKEDDIAFNEKKMINKAINLLETLNPEQLIRIARLCGLPVSDQTGQMAVYNYLDEFVKQGTISSGENKGKSSVRFFLGIAEMKNDNLMLKDKIAQAFEHSIIRKFKKKIWKGEQELADNEEELFALLSSSKGQDWLIAIDEELKAKKSITQSIN